MNDHLFHALQAIVPVPLNKQMIERPVDASFGDFALPCFPFAQVLRKSPTEIAETIASTFSHPDIERIQAINGYVNFFFKRVERTKDVLLSILTQRTSYGSNNDGQKGVITIDLSSPNIAKPFSMGHLRSTVIGHSLARILSKNGYVPIKINYVGDWGTQFGKLLTAYRKWGDAAEIQQAPIQTLLQLYVRFHEEAENDPSLNEEGRAAFKQLEDGDEDAIALWEWFREVSLQEFERIYELLGIDFDEVSGESYYNDQMVSVIHELATKGLLKESDGALVVPVGEDLPPCLIKKTDGATLYATRDLAAAIDRQKKYRFVRSLYVVGNEQRLHFQQIKRVLHLMDYPWAHSLTHVPFGLILQNGTKMSTRKGKIVLLEEVLNEAIALAEQNITAKNPSLQRKKEVARAVGVGAILFSDLKQHRKHDIAFDLKKMLQTEGETGPYVQYAHARAHALLRKVPQPSSDLQLTTVNDFEWRVIKILEQFPDAVRRACETLDPSIIAKYAIQLAQSFHSFYGNVPILTASEQERSYRIQLVTCVTIVLAEALRLLGMQAPDEM